MRRGREAEFLLRRTLRLLSPLAWPTLASFAAATTTIATALAFRARQVSFTLRLRRSGSRSRVLDGRAVFTFGLHAAQGFLLLRLLLGGEFAGDALSLRFTGTVLATLAPAAFRTRAALGTITRPPV